MHARVKSCLQRDLVFGVCGFFSVWPVACRPMNLLVLLPFDHIYAYFISCLENHLMKLVHAHHLMKCMISPISAPYEVCFFFLKAFRPFTYGSHCSLKDHAILSYIGQKLIHEPRQDAEES